MKPDSNWQPISMLPMIAKMIDDQLEEVQKQYTLIFCTSDFIQKMHYEIDSNSNNIGTI